MPNTAVTLLPLTPPNRVLTSLTNTFGSGAPHGKWAAFELHAAGDPGPQITDPIQPNEVLYFELVLDNFVPMSGRDVHIVPVVATLPLFGFENTYFMGVSAFTTGNKAVIDDFGTTIVTMNNNPGMPNGYGPVRPLAWP